MDKFGSEEPVRVLVMDDERIIRETVMRVLEADGCAVDTARNGKHAIALYRAAHGSSHPYDMVLLDLTVPGGDGAVESLGELKLINPDIRAIVTSGYHNSPVMQQPERFGFCARLKKPWNIDGLRRLVKVVADLEASPS